MAGALPSLARGEAHRSTEAQSAPAQRVVLRPDAVFAQFGFKEAHDLTLAGKEWTGAGVRVTAEPTEAGSTVELPVSIASPAGKLTHVHLRWRNKVTPGTRIIGDAWERAYGDLEWRGLVPERVMPWYYIAYDGKTLRAMGVKTQPAAFCFWMRDAEGISLWIDVRNGGEPTQLGSRVLHACTVTARSSSVDAAAIPQFSREFCKQMCPAPKLPNTPLYGTNDWNYTYGNNSTAGTLRNADLIAELAPKGKSRPFIVVDDGWQDPARFPSLPDLAAQLRNREMHPGIWVRPVRAPASAQSTLLLPPARFGAYARRAAPAFDPTNAEALHEITEQVRLPASWGFEFIKHDFSTWEIFGRWGSSMGAEVTAPGWHFQDQTRTNAEIIKDLYNAIRKAAGADRTILGCNTVGHIAAGIFESQRVADDTSGREWERTRRNGVNGLAHRIGQHQTFFYVDADCAAITPKEDLRLSRQWVDVVARTGTSLFLSPDPAAMNDETKAIMRDGMALVCEEAEGAPLNSLDSTTPQAWHFTRPDVSDQNYDWSSADGISPVLVT